MRHEFNTIMFTCRFWMSKQSSVASKKKASIKATGGVKQKTGSSLLGAAGSDRDRDRTVTAGPRRTSSARKKSAAQRLADAAKKLQNQSKTDRSWYSRWLPNTIVQPIQAVKGLLTQHVFRCETNDQWIGNIKDMYEKLDKTLWVLVTNAPLYARQEFINDLALLRERLKRFQSLLVSQQQSAKIVGEYQLECLTTSQLTTLQGIRRTVEVIYETIVLSVRSKLESTTAKYMDELKDAVGKPLQLPTPVQQTTTAATPVGLTTVFVPQQQPSSQPRPRVNSSTGIPINPLAQQAPAQQLYQNPFSLETEPVIQTNPFQQQQQQQYQFATPSRYQPNTLVSPFGNNPTSYDV